MRAMDDPMLTVIPPIGDNKSAVLLIKKSCIRNRCHVVQPPLRANNTSVAAGVLEIGNISDFPSNVWNFSVLPVYVISLMALGGTVAIGMVPLAVLDAYRSIINIRRLICERRHIKKHLSVAGPQISSDFSSLVIDAYINYHDILTEIVPRLLNDLLLGFATLTVSIGCYMAIYGGNGTVYIWSNYLTNWIGNVPVVLFGVINIMWSVREIFRACTMSAVVGKVDLKCIWEPSVDICKLIKIRRNWVITYGIVSGTFVAFGGAGAMVTSTYTWGYFMIIPTLMAAFFSSYILRKKINYDRYLYPQYEEYWNIRELVDKIAFFEKNRELLIELKAKSKDGSKKWFIEYLTKYEDLKSRYVTYITQDKIFESHYVIQQHRVLMQMTENNLFSSFAKMLHDNKDLSAALIEQPTSGELLIVNSLSILESNVFEHNTILAAEFMNVAQSCITNIGYLQIINRQRFLLDAISTYAYVERMEKNKSARTNSRLSLLRLFNAPRSLDD